MSAHYCYLAEPIDESPTSHGEVLANWLHQSKVPFYRPREAWSWAARPLGGIIQVINNMALGGCSVLVACLPRGVHTLGVPMEIQKAIDRNIDVVICTDRDPGASAALAFLREQPQIKHWCSSPIEAATEAARLLGGHRGEQAPVFVAGGVVSGGANEPTLTTWTVTDGVATNDQPITVEGIGHDMARQLMGCVCEEEGIGLPRWAVLCPVHGATPPNEMFETATQTLRDIERGQTGTLPFIVNENQETVFRRPESADRHLLRIQPDIGVVRGYWANHMAEGKPGVAPLPGRHLGDVGNDLSVLNGYTLMVGQRAHLRCGMAVQLPEGYWGLIQGRSSSWNRGLSVKASVIDGGYRGELWVDVHNISKETVQVERGDRLAQLILMPIPPQVQWVQVDELDESSRNEAGYGSTGR